MSPRRAPASRGESTLSAPLPVRPGAFGGFLERLRSAARPSAVLFVGEYKFPSHGYDSALLDRALEVLADATRESHAFFVHDAEGDGFEEKALFADFAAPPLFAPSRAIVVRRAEPLCKISGRARKPGERTPFEAAAVRFATETRDGSVLLLALPTRTEKDPLAADLLAAGGAVVVCPKEGEGEAASGFLLAAAILEGRAGDALRLLGEIRRDGLALAPGKRERDARALYPILFARIYEGARRAAAVRRLLDAGASIREAGEAVSAKAWPGSDLDRAARARSPAGHARLLRGLRDLEAGVKGGLEGDALAALEAFAALHRTEKR